MTRVLAVADSDSYVKWSAATLDALPVSFQRELVVLRSPITPSAAQIAAAAGRPVTEVSLVALLWRVSVHRPDVLLLGCTGPVVQAALAFPVLRHGRRRPVVITGLPGISVPATERAMQFRSACDLFLLHSHRERADFSELARELAPELQIALARLPFLDRRRGPSPSLAPDQPPRRNDMSHPPDTPDRTDIVFAAQARVPPGYEDRRRVLLSLADTLPAGSVVVKLRAVEGEEQTHRERWSYPQLWAELLAQGRVPADAVRFSSGSMGEALSRARGFATVSSTAALEAIAEGVPTLLISDFGVSTQLINTVFQGSGCLGTLEDLRDGRFPAPNEQWLVDNYFHPTQDSDWLERLAALVEQRAYAGLPVRRLSRVGRRGASARRLLRLLLPHGWWPVLRGARRRARRAWRRAGLLRRAG